MSARDRAEGLLIHYMRTAFRAAGLVWNEDNESEMAVLLDAIEEMVTDQIRSHAENAPHAYPDGSRS